MVSNKKKSRESGTQSPVHRYNDKGSSSHSSSNNVNKVNDRDDILDRRISTEPDATGTPLSPLRSPIALSSTPSRNLRTRRLNAPSTPRIVRTFSSPRTTTLHANNSVHDAMRSTFGSPIKRRHPESSVYRSRGNGRSIDVPMTSNSNHDPQGHARAVINFNTKHVVLSVSSGDQHDSWDDDDNFFDKDALEQVFSPPKRKRAQDGCDLDCPTLRTVRGSSSFCSASHASGESKNHRSNELRQSQSMRSPLKERRTSNGAARFISNPPQQSVDYRNFFTNTADLIEEPCCKERGSKCAIVQTASGYEVKLKGIHDAETSSASTVEQTIKPMAPENDDLQRGRSYSEDLPHLRASNIRRGSNSLFLPSAKTPRKARSKTEDETQFSCHKSTYKDSGTSLSNAAFNPAKLPSLTPQWWTAQTPDPNARQPYPTQRLNAADEKNIAPSILKNDRNTARRPQCPLKTMWNEEECRVNKDAGDDHWEEHRIPRRTESEDTLSPTSTPFRFTSFPASLPRIQPKGLKATALPPTEDLPSQWLNYDCSNLEAGRNFTNLKSEKSQSETGDVHSSPGTRSGNSNTQDDSSLKSDQDDNSLSHGKVVRMAACTRQTFEPILEGSGSRCSPAFHAEGDRNEDKPCPNILFQGEPEGEHDATQGEPPSPMHSQDGSGYGDADPHLAKSVDVSHDSTLSSITASPTPYRPQARSGHFAPGKTLRSRPSVPQLSTPMELDSADLHKVASGCQLQWDDDNGLDAALEDEVTSKKASCTRLNFNSLMSPGDGSAGKKELKEDLDKTVVKSKIALKRTFSHDTKGYDEDNEGSDEMHHEVDHGRSEGGTGARIQFDFGSSSEWPASCAVHEARPRINTSDNIFGEQTDVSPIRADSAASASSHKSPASFQYEENHSLASPMISSSATSGGHQADANAKWSHDTTKKHLRTSSSGTSNLFDDLSTPDIVNRSGVGSSLHKDGKEFDTPNSSERRKAKVRPMPDMAAFDSSSADETQQNSFSSVASAKTACPPTPVRTPAWAMKDNKVKPLSLHRLNSLQATKVLADCSVSMADDLQDERYDAEGGASKKACDSDVDDADMDDDLDPEIEQANFCRGCWNYKTVTSGFNGNPAKNVNPADDPETGELIIVSFETDFENLGLLGSGAFADVYKARYKSDGRVYAIKRNRRQFRSRRDRDRTMMEVKIMQKLQHPEGNSNASLSQYLIRFVRAWQQDGHFYCQTEICCRENCHDLIAVWSIDWEGSRRKYPRFSALLAENYQGTPKSPMGRPILPESSIWKIFHDVVSGLSYMHSNGVVHFDIKPCNILFDPNNGQGCICKIGDFGMAGAIGSEEDGQEGDTAFMAPELLNSCKKDPSADIFSLGLTLYNLAADPSWNIPSEGERFKEIRSKGHQPELLPSRSQELKHLIQSMITPDRETRPSAQGILKNSPQVHSASTGPDKFLTAFVRDAQEFERLREKEIALKYQIARDRRTTPTSFLFSSKELVDRMDEVRTPTANTPSLNYMQGGRSVFRR